MARPKKARRLELVRLEARETPSFSGPTRPDLVDQRYFNLAAGQFDEGSLTDLIYFGGPTPGFHILANQGNNTFTPTEPTGDLPNDLNLISVHSARLNADTAEDLIVFGTDAGGKFVLDVFRGDGGGAFTRFPGSPLVSEGADSTFHVRPADLNADGKTDLLTGGKAMFLGNGDGTFTRIDDAVPDTVSPLRAVGDFTGDGSPDLAGLAQAGDGTVIILAGDKSGKFLTPVGDEPFGVGEGASLLAFGDVNGGGKADLVVRTA